MASRISLAIDQAEAARLIFSAEPYGRKASWLHCDIVKTANAPIAVGPGIVRAILRHEAVEGGRAVMGTLWHGADRAFPNAAAFAEHFPPFIPPMRHYAVRKIMRDLIGEIPMRAGSYLQDVVASTFAAVGPAPIDLAAQAFRPMTARWATLLAGLQPEDAPDIYRLADLVEPLIDFACRKKELAEVERIVERLLSHHAAVQALLGSSSNPAVRRLVDDLAEAYETESSAESTVLDIPRLDGVKRRG